jgi:hypothetical protein
MTQSHRYGQLDQTSGPSGRRGLSRRSHYSGSYAAVRPEWSRGWAYTDTAAWSDPTMLTSTIPNAISAGQDPGESWASVLATLDSYDPYRVFSNAFLNSFMP